MIKTETNTNTETKTKTETETDTDTERLRQKQRREFHQKLSSYKQATVHSNIRCTLPFYTQSVMTYSEHYSRLGNCWTRMSINRRLCHV